jgi:hypothetical protein
VSFLNATLLFGSLAVVLPIALHLLGKREPKRVAFPAIRFLTRRLQSNRRRMQVKRWVLLAVRVAVLALAAIALAQPTIHRELIGTWTGIGAIGVIGLLVIGLAVWALVADLSPAIRWGLLVCGVVLVLVAGGWGARTIAGGPRPVNTTTAPAAVAIVVDNSLTMGYGEEDATRLDAAKETGLWLVGRYPAESRFALIDRSARPAAFALDASFIQRGFERIEPLETVRPLRERIEAAIKLLRTSDLPRKTLFIISDLTRAGWGDSDQATDWNSLVGEIAADPPIAIHIVDAGSNVYRNRKLGSVQLTDATPAANVASTLTVLVQTERGTGSDGGNPESGNSATASSTTASSATANSGSGDLESGNPARGNSERPVTVQARLFEQQPGLPIQRDGKTVYPRLKTVDRASVAAGGGGASVTLTLPPLEYGTHHGVVELVDDDLLEIDNIRYFTVVVEPPRRILVVCEHPAEREVLTAIFNPYGSDDPRREYEIDFALMSRLREYNLGDYATVAIFNPPLPAAAQRNALDAWVRGGGRLWLTLGPALDADQPGESIDWPLVGNPQRIWRVPEPGTFAEVTRPGHPSLAALAAVPGGVPWNAFRVYHYWQLDADSEFVELLGYAGTDHAALADQQLGAGRVMVLTTPLPAVVPPADRWNDLLSTTLSGAWPVYFILAQQIVEDLSGGFKADLNVGVGQPVALPVAGQAGERYQLFAPGEPPVPIDVADSVVVPGIPLRAGNYWLRAAANQQAGFSANLTPPATAMERLPEADLDRFLGADMYQLVRDRDDIQLAEGQASTSRPLYPIVMLVVAALFMLEQILANRFYPRSAAAIGDSPGAGGDRPAKKVAAA